jgi:hypothetical protein
VTAQVPEQLILDGARVGMTSCPALPESHARIVEIAPDRRSRTGAAGLATSTACWRQYIGTWEVRHDRLYLTSLVGRYELTTGEPLPADWVTDVLRIPHGEPLRYVHLGFETIFEQELHLDVEEGLVTGRSLVRYDADGEVVSVVPTGWRIA